MRIALLTFLEQSKYYFWVMEKAAGGRLILVGDPLGSQPWNSWAHNTATLSGQINHLNVPAVKRP